MTDAAPMPRAILARTATARGLELAPATLDALARVVGDWAAASSVSLLQQRLKNRPRAGAIAFATPTADSLAAPLRIGGVSALVQNARTGRLYAFTATIAAGISGDDIARAVHGLLTRRKSDSPSIPFTRRLGVEGLGYGIMSVPPPTVASVGPFHPWLGRLSDMTGLEPSPDERHSRLPKAAEILTEASHRAYLTLNPVGAEAKGHIGLLKAVLVSRMLGTLEHDPLFALADKEDRHAAIEHAAALAQPFADRAALRLKARMTSFRNTIAPSARAAMFLANTHKVASANFYNAGGNTELQTRRLQAVESFPLLNRLLSGDAALRAAVDRAQPITPILTDSFHASRAVLKHLNRVSYHEAGMPAQAHIRELLPILSQIKPDYLPGRGNADIKAQWTAFTETATAPGLDRIHELVGLSPAQLLNRGEATWRDGTALRLLDENGIEALIGFTRANLIPIALDVAREIAPKLTPFQTVAAAFAPFGAGDHPLAHAVLRDRNFSSIQKDCERWNAAQHRIASTLERPGVKVGHWEPLTAPWTYQAGDKTLTVRALTSPHELHEASDRLGNCLWSYSPSCQFHRSHILAIEDARGQILSAGEIRLRETPDPETGSWLRLVQHEGPVKHGRKASAEAERALRAYLLRVERGQIPCDREGIERKLAARRDARDHTSEAQLVGYDPRNAELRAKALQAYAFMLPKKERDLDPRQWAATTGLEALIRDRLLAAREKPYLSGKIPQVLRGAVQER